MQHLQDSKLAAEKPARARNFLSGLKMSRGRAILGSWIGSNAELQLDSRAFCAQVDRTGVQDCTRFDTKPDMSVASLGPHMGLCRWYIEYVQCYQHDS